MEHKRVLTVQDISCFGQCSITVALPIISACGVETAILPSAVLSTHTGGFTGFTYRDLTDDMEPIMEHWKKENIQFDCLYTGYLGSVRYMEYVRKLHEEVIKKDGLFIADPAMADNGKLYSGFTLEYAANMAELCKDADIILPNITEACFMTNTEILLAEHTKEYIERLLDALNSFTSGQIVLKGISFEKGKLGVAVRDAKNGTTEYYFTQKLSRSYHGTGDCFAAAFTGGMMQGMSPLEAASVAADFVVESIRKTETDQEHFYGVKFEKALPMLTQRINH